MKTLLYFLIIWVGNLYVLTAAVPHGSLNSHLHTPPDEGMLPLNQLKKRQLQSLGLQLSDEQIFSTGDVSLVQALVRVGGCTGSFVSAEGLIITNHHCAFGAVAAASSVGKDYITDGFLARTRGDEIPAKGLTVRITIDFEDVSEKVLAGLSDDLDPARKTETIRRNVKHIEEEAKGARPEYLHEVSEMFVGRSYVLFRYQTINDIRMVYVPPRSVGEFGGESDNWVWPRHTGDFAFLRAYVGSDGSPATYSPDNKPFVPQNHLRVNASGVREEDFVFVMGYPGRTFRHYPASYLEYQRDQLLPITSETYDWLIAAIDRLGEADPEARIRLASRQKSLANVTKNYKGKIQGLRRVDIIGEKRRQEDELQRLTLPEAPFTHCAGVIRSLDSLYAMLAQDAPLKLWLNNLQQNSPTFSMAMTRAEARRQWVTGKDSSSDSLRKLLVSTVIKQNERLRSGYEPRLDTSFLRFMMRAPSKWAAQHRSATVESLWKQYRLGDQSDAVVGAWLAKGLPYDAEQLMGTLNSNPEKSLRSKGSLDELADVMVLEVQRLMNREKAINAQLSVLLPQYLELKLALVGDEFVPDANSTLRLTYGHVRGYQPADAEVQTPFTHLAGMQAKSRAATGDAEKEADYLIYGPLQEKMQSDRSAESIPVAFLYNLDTTGGNSGSPVMNARGELVGVNFDRAFTATINDFAWNEQYSRSIGVDVRFVLWMVDEVAGASHLIKEMGVVR
ncbi:MAG: S46 family peptidase [Sphingomonadales bacterium]|nr:S46 family peptidase [Sphingomonadales bacterium]